MGTENEGMHSCVLERISFLAGFFFTVYDTVHFNYVRLGIVHGLNIAGGGEQMEMWVRDKGRFSLLMEKRVSDSLWLAEGVCLVRSPASSLRGVEVREVVVRRQR